MSTSHPLLIFADLLYRDEHATVERTARMEAFLRAASLDVGEATRLISDAAAESKYCAFHATRFLDQLRTLSAVSSLLPPPVRVLDIGVAPVATMYASLIPGIELQTAGLPWTTPAEATARRFGASSHHYIDIEEESFAEKLPNLTGTFDVVIFCEVIEHIRASPQEQIADLLGLLRPSGYLVVSTPNGIWRGWVARLMTGRRLDTIYSRQKRKFGNGRDFHVREYTPLELREAVTEVGGKILEEGLFDWYGMQPDHPLQQVSARQAMLFVIQKRPDGC